VQRSRLDRFVAPSSRPSPLAKRLVLVCGLTLFQLLAAGLAAAEPMKVEFFRFRMPDGKTEVRQGSGLHYGRLGDREGLWAVPDRNGDESASHIIFIDHKRLSDVRQGEAIIATEAFRAAAPAQGWDAFDREHAAIAEPVLATLRRQIESASREENAMLDFEGVTIGRRTPQGPDRLFAVIETPHSMVLEFDLDTGPGPGRAVLRDCFCYPERENERGTDSNDGLEGIAWLGPPSVFYLCEEGTAPHSPTDKLHFWLKPRLMRCTLQDARTLLDDAWSAAATTNLEKRRTGKSQTLNALSAIDDRQLLAVDRNGGWIHVVDAASGSVTPWLDLYDAKTRKSGEPVVPGLNLRERLAHFPGPRVMSYVSIEGIARETNGTVWLIDDPAMPEPFREACLVRVKNPPPPPKPASRPGG